MTSSDPAGPVTTAAAESVVSSGPYKPDSAITFRVTSIEKSEIRSVAEKLGLSVTEYLLRLHRAAKALADSIE